jgi:hypothetical protein
MRSLLLLCFFFWSALTAIAQTKYDCRWMMGFFEDASTPGYGTAMINFCDGSPQVSPIASNPMSFNATNASISDEEGNFLFYTNGFTIKNAFHQTMLNGTGLNPGDELGLEDIGMSMPQGALILPFPENPDKYVVFHAGSFFSSTLLGAYPLYYSMVDITLDNERGGVIEKNVVLRADTLEHGKILATRHANGRDWWIVTPRLTDGRLLRFLLTPQGITDIGPTQQSLFVFRDFGNAAFSPDGAYYAHTSSTSTPFETPITILRFDRCSGDFSVIEQHIDNDLATGLSFVAFSPNSRYLYQSFGNIVNQFDMEAPSISSSKTLVAVYDGYQEEVVGAPPAPTSFYIPQLSPDGRIYIATGYLTSFLHIIEHPDIFGTDCNVVQRAIQLPVINATLPNFPNFNLGVLEGSPCDSIISSSTNHWPLAETEPLRIFPNPAQGYFTVATDAPAIRLRLYDSMGRQLHAQALAAGQPEHRIALPAGLPAGVYVVVVEGGAGVLGRGRVVVAR